MTLPTEAEVARRLDRVHQRIADAGGSPDEVTVVAVTKTFDPAVYAAVAGAGLTDIGENYAQELLAKTDDARRHELAVHFIGGLQRNKVKKLAPVVTLWHTIDRPELVDEVAKRAPGAAILIQVDVTGESGKSGADPSVVPELVARGREAGLEVRGLMTVGPTDPSVDPRPGFERVTALSVELGLAERSMGMSGDLETAVAAGSTMVRIGTALLGPRPSSSAVRPQ